MKNHYEINGDSVLIHLQRINGHNLSTTIDLSDLHIADSFPHTWYAVWSKKTKSFYVSGSISISGKRTTMKLHRLITDAPPTMQVDHINHDTLDNRKSTNLEIVTHADNQKNKIKPQENNKSSGVRGVSWHSQHRKWHAYVKVDRRLYALGYYSDLRVASSIAKKIRDDMKFVKNVTKEWIEEWKSTQPQEEEHAKTEEEA